MFVVAKRDRIARDVVLAAGITGAVALEGARVVSVSGEDSPADAFIRTVIAAQYEHGLIRSRACSLSVANSVRVAARLPRGEGSRGHGARQLGMRTRVLSLRPVVITERPAGVT